MPRCNLTLKQKAQLIELSKELSTGQLAKKFRVHTTTVTRTIRKKDRILQQASRVNPNFKTVQTNLRSEEHDTMILEYIKDQQEANRPISVSDICDKAVEYAEALGREIKSHRAWWRRFRVRCNVVRSKLTRDEKPKTSKKRTKTAPPTATATSDPAQECDGAGVRVAGERVEDEVSEVVELLKETVREPEDQIRSEEFLAIEDDKAVELELVTIDLPVKMDIIATNHDELPTSNDAGICDGAAADSADQPTDVNEDLTADKKPRANSKRNGLTSEARGAPKKTKRAGRDETSKQLRSTTTKANKPTAKKNNSPVINDKNFTFKIKEASTKGSSTRSSDGPAEP